MKLLAHTEADVIAAMEYELGEAGASTRVARDLAAQWGEGRYDDAELADGVDVGDLWEDACELLNDYTDGLRDDAVNARVKAWKEDRL